MPIAQVRAWREAFYFWKALHAGGPSSMDFIYFLGLNKKQRSCDGRGGARSAPCGFLMSPKRRVRAAHGRAREAKTH